MLSLETIAAEHLDKLCGQYADCLQNLGHIQQYTITLYTVNWRFLFVYERKYQFIHGRIRRQLYCLRAVCL